MERCTVRLTINGQLIERSVEPRTLLSQFLREEMGLTGTHVGCDTSQCGACTVLVDDLAVKSCTVFAVQADGSHVTTVEGLSGPLGNHAVQEAFQQEHGLQCGFCTPGALMLSAWYVEHHAKSSQQEIREMLDGLICRCTGYENIVRAVMQAQRLSTVVEEPEPKEVSS